MKNSIIIAVIAIGAIFNGNAANPTTAVTTTTTTTENATITRTETPVRFMDRDFWKITITITFSRPIKVEISFEAMMVGGSGDNNTTIEASNVSLENGALNFSLPENTKALAGATEFRVVKGGTFKTADGKTCEVKTGQVFRQHKPFSFKGAYSVTSPRDVSTGQASGKN